MPTDDGVVNVSIAVPAPIPIVWRAMTMPDQVREWFGDLDGPLAPGVALRIDFGDGDFFDVEVDELRWEETISFRWRFLGVGPESVIRFGLRRGAVQTTVSVLDSCPGRQPSEASQLEAGWQDFLGRLRTYLSTGKSARYVWREVIDGGTNFPVGTWLPLSESGVVDWMPIATEGTRPAWFFIVDDDGPRRFAIRDWTIVGDWYLHFSVVIPGGGTTRCEVHTTRVGDEIQLTVCHHGWVQLTLSDLQKRSLRHRFAAAWTAALKVAADCASHRRESQ
jgi:uncharacterized protein YndB with AHSA1/START domain